jgi:hypothetical protein
MDPKYDPGVPKKSDGVVIPVNISKILKTLN